MEFLGQLGWTSASLLTAQDQYSLSVAKVSGQWYMTDAFRARPLPLLYGDIRVGVKGRGEGQAAQDTQPLSASPCLWPLRQEEARVLFSLRGRSMRHIAAFWIHGWKDGLVLQ